MAFPINAAPALLIAVLIVGVRCQAAPLAPPSKTEEGVPPTPKHLEFCRIAHLPVAAVAAASGAKDAGAGGDNAKDAPPPKGEGGEKVPTQVQIGVFACCPESQKGNAVVVFRNLGVYKGVFFDHNADGNHE